MPMMSSWQAPWQTGSVSRCPNPRGKPPGSTSSTPGMLSFLEDRLLIFHFQGGKAFLQVSGGWPLGRGGDRGQGGARGQGLECDRGQEVRLRGVWCPRLWQLHPKERREKQVREELFLRLLVPGEIKTIHYVESKSIFVSAQNLIFQVSPNFDKLNIKMKTPPTLPPHLLQVLNLNFPWMHNNIFSWINPSNIYQVILNKDVSYQPDPILLEEPSHVMLNHIYAQVKKYIFFPKEKSEGK